MKDYRGELIALGKLTKEWVEPREIYENVVWENFSDETYMSMGYKLYREKNILEELVELELVNDGYPSVKAINLLIEIADSGAIEEGYIFNDDTERFEKENNEIETDKTVTRNENILQVKYDIDLKCAGIDFVGVSECYKFECNGIPCIKDNKLELVKSIFLQMGTERYIIKFIEINSIIYPISDIEWYGLDTENLFEQMNLILTEEQIPNSYIKVSNKYYEVKVYSKGSIR